MAKKAKQAARKRTTKSAVRQANGRRTRTARSTTSRPKASRKKTGTRSAPARPGRRRPVEEPSSTLGHVAARARGVVTGAVSAVRRRISPVGELDAIELLEQEHRRFEALLAEGEATTGAARKARRKILDTLTAELNAHELREETVLYPALQTHAWARDVVLEGFQEHHVADVLVHELHQVATDDEAWAAKFKVLKENIEHHIQDEERDLFQMARGMFSREQLLDLGTRMRQAARGAGRKRR